MKLKFLLAALTTLLLAACSAGTTTTDIPDATGVPVLISAGSAGHAFFGVVTSGTAGNTGDLDCRDFVSQGEAQIYFNSHGGSSTNNVDALDWNHNGVPCEVNEDWAVRSNRWSSSTATPAPSITPAPSAGLCWVNGYYRSNGTYVKGYWRRC